MNKITNQELDDSIKIGDKNKLNTLNKSTVVDALNEVTDKIKRNYKNNLIHTTKFIGTTLPDGWVQSGGWTVSNGLQSPTSGGWSTIAYWNKYTTLDRTTVRANIIVNDINSKFSIVRKPDASYAIKGTVVEVDCQNKVINLYNHYNGTSSTTILKSTNITFNFIAGREYLCELIHIDGYNKFVITDKITQSKSYIEHDNGLNVNENCGMQCGSPAIMFHKGNVLIKKFEYVCNMPKDPKVLFLGDSMTEGNGTIGLPEDYDSRFQFKIFKHLNGNVVISGRGGESSGGLINRLSVDLDYFEPEFVFIFIGANDTSYSTWQSNINTIISRIISKNAVPILATLAPRADRQSFINQVNSWIRSSGYSYVEFAKALTLNNDGITWNHNYVISDLVHPNHIGNDVMYNQCLIDVPEIFD